MALPPENFQIDLDNGTAAFRVTDLPMPDYISIPNALALTPTVVPPTAGAVSFDLRWSEAGDPLPIKDGGRLFAGQFREGTAKIAWSGSVGGFRFISDPAETSVSQFAAIGQEHNGAFFAPELGGQAGAQLAGSSGGAFDYYQIASPSGGPLTLTLSYAPFDAPRAHAVGVNVYQQGATLGSAHGQATGLGDPVSRAGASLTVTPNAGGGPALIQVFNYGDATVGYTLTVAG